MRNLTVSATHRRLRIVCQSLTDALLEPVGRFMCNPFQEEVEGDSVASKIATLFHRKSSGVEDKILTLQLLS